MTLTITDTQMTSDVTHHIAVYDPDAMWGVTWLPGRTLTLDEASTAMEIADMIADPEQGGEDYGTVLNDLARELGMTGAEAVELVLEPLPDEPSEVLATTEMERAINDPTDAYYLTDAEACFMVTGGDPNRARQFLTRMVIDQPDTVATQISQAMKARADDTAEAIADGLTGTKRAPADKIVLPALTAEATAELETLLDTDLSQDIAAVETEDGRHEVDHICRYCQRVDSFTPDQADVYAAHMATAAADARSNALAADDAERGPAS